MSGGQILLTIAIEVAYGDCYWTRWKHPSASRDLEGAIAVAQQDGHGVETGADQVLAAIAIEVAHGDYGKVSCVNILSGLKGSIALAQ